jgi:hypothetical protein
MQLVQTIRMRFADNADPTRATQWIDFQLPPTILKAPGQNEPLGDPETRYVAEIRLAALRHVRDVIGDETQRLPGLAIPLFLQLKLPTPNISLLCRHAPTLECALKSSSAAARNRACRNVFRVRGILYRTPTY